MRILNFGVVGTSWITDAYIQGALLTDKWNLRAVYSRTMERAIDYAKKFEIPYAFDDLLEMAKSPLIDAVYIASPNSLHVSQSLMFIRNGKHVICEKPVASHASEVKMLIEEAEKYGVIFMEAIMFMHIPQKTWFEDAIKKIGDIKMAKVDFCQRSSKLDALLSGELPNIFNPEMETGGLMDLGVYCIYPVIYLFGMPDEIDVRVNMLPSGVDGSGVITFIYSDKLITMPYSKISQAGTGSDFQGTLGTLSTPSISKLDSMVVRNNGGIKKVLNGETPKVDLMACEARDFYKYITEKRTYANEYKQCCEMSYKVAKVMEEIRKKAGIVFPSDNK